MDRSDRIVNFLERYPPDTYQVVPLIKNVPNSNWVKIIYIYMHWETPFEYCNQLLQKFIDEDVIFMVARIWGSRFPADWEKDLVHLNHLTNHFIEEV